MTRTTTKPRQTYTPAFFALLATRTTGQAAEIVRVVDDLAHSDVAASKLWTPAQRRAMRKTGAR